MPRNTRNIYSRLLHHEMCIENITYLKLCFKHFSMGKAKKRVNPKVTSRTSRNFKKRYAEELLRAIDKLPPP
jgi:hypothetical protein